MQTLIYKTELFVERAPAWLVPNSPVELRPQADGTITAFARRPSRWIPFWGEVRPVRIGVLTEDAAMLLRPVLETGIVLRVRIVELHPAHLTTDQRARISVSVWGPVSKMGESCYLRRQGIPDEIFAITFLDRSAAPDERCPYIVAGADATPI